MDPNAVMSFLLGVVFTWFVFLGSIFIGGCASDHNFEKSTREKFVTAFTLSSGAALAMGLLIHYLLSYAMFESERIVSIIWIQCSTVFIGCWVVPGCRLLSTLASRISLKYLNW